MRNFFGHEVITNLWNAIGRPSSEKLAYWVFGMSQKFEVLNTRLRRISDTTVSTRNKNAREIYFDKLD